MPDETQTPPPNISPNPAPPKEPEVTPPWVSPTSTQTEPPSQPTQPPSSPASEPTISPAPEPPSRPSTDSTILTSRGNGWFKKLLLIVLIILLLVGGGFLLTRFLPNLKPSSQITLNYWGLWEEGPVLEGVLNEWSKANPNIKINYSKQSPREYRERLQSALSRSDGPDIFRFHITWVPMLKNELQAVPADVMSTSQFEGSYYPVMKDELRSGTGYLGIPLEVDTLGLFYNQDIFQAGGKTPPTTWDELRKTACELTTRDENQKIQTAGASLGTTNNVDHWSDILGLMMAQNGVDWNNLQTSLAEDALTFYTIFSQPEACKEANPGVNSVWDDTLPASTLAFASGKLAMYFGFSWDVFEVLNINPSLRFRVVPAPQLPGTNIAWASFWVEGVSKKSAHSKETWQFLKFLSSKETMEKLYQAEAGVRLFGEPYARVEMANLLAKDTMVSPFISQAPNAQTWFLTSRTFDNGIDDRMIKYFEDAVNGVNSGKSAKEVLQTASSGVTSLLTQYNVLTKTSTR